MAIVGAGFTLSQILDAWHQGRFNVVVSDYLLQELRRTLTNPYFSNRLTHNDVQTFLAFVQSTAEVTPVTVTISGVATHPEDDLVLATAVSAAADYLVTGDRRFRARVPQYQGVRLVSPAEFRALLTPDTDSLP